MTNLTDANINLANKVVVKANNMMTKDVTRETMQKLIQQIQG